MSTLGPATMAAALTASAQLIESLRLERDAAQREAAELREQIAAEIEALGATFEAGQPILVDRNYVANIARGTP